MDRLTPPPLPLDLVTLGQTAADLAANQWSEATRDRYGSGWRTFVAWTRARAMAAMPAAPDTVALYLADRCVSVSVSTLNTELAAINQAHRVLGEMSPTTHPKVKAILRGIRRRYGVAVTRKRAISLDDLVAMVAKCPPNLTGRRDVALLTLGWASAMRRSELAALCLHHVSQMPQGLRISIPKSKTDQEGEGQLVAIPYAQKHPTVCPVVAYRQWLQWSGIDSGPVFRSINQHQQIGPSISPRSVARIVQRAGVSIGIPVDELGGHSLRAGLATECGRAGVPERLIARQTRHRSIKVLRTYIRDGTLWTEHPLTDLL